MKKILNFSLCVLLALSLSMGNVATVVNATGIDGETVVDTFASNEKEENGQKGEVSTVETKETEEPELAKETVKPESTMETVKQKSTEEPMTNQKEKSQLKTESKSTEESKGIVFFIDLNIADNVDTVQTIGGKKIESTKKNVTVDIRKLRVTKSNGNRIFVYENKAFAKEGKRKYCSLNLPFSVKKELKVSLDFIVTVDGEEYSVPFEKTYKASDEECKALGYMKIDITEAQVLEAITNTVTFVDYDGTVLSVNDGVLTGTSAIAPKNPERTSYTFTGWSTAFDKVTGDLTVEAQYRANSYNVTFVDYDGTLIGKVQKVNYATAAIPPTNPVREGYTFIGWDKEFGRITGDLIVTAEYKVNKYKVTFVDCDETKLGETQNIEYGKSATAPADPTRAGYKFIGWNVDFKEVKCDLTVKAQYQQLPSVLTGTAMFFILNGDERPSEPASHPKKNYTYLGTGIIWLEKVCNDDDGVVKNIIEAPSMIEEGWTVRWYVIKKEVDGWHVDGIKEKIKEPTPSVTSGPAIKQTEIPTGSAVEPDDSNVTPSAVVSATPSVSPTTTPSNPKPYMPYVGPSSPQKTEAPTGSMETQKPEDSTVIPGTSNPTAMPTAAVTDAVTATPVTGVEAGKEDTNGETVNTEVTAAPTVGVEVKEDEIPDSVAVASSTPATVPTVVPTEQVEATVAPTPNVGDKITVQDTILPDSPSNSDEETDGNDNVTDKDDAVEIEEEDMPNSGAEADEESDDASEVDDDKEVTDAEEVEVEEDETASSLPQTGVMSANVFYYIGSMIFVFGICFLTLVRKKSN